MSAKRKIIKLAGVCFAAFLVFVLTTQPADLPAPLLVIPFVLLFLGLLFVFYVIFKDQRVARGRGGWHLVLLLAGLPVVLLALQSVGQLSWRDMATITVLFVITYIYVSRIVKTEKTER